MSTIGTSFAPVAAPTRQPIHLAMQRLWLGGRILPAGARLTVEHIFRSNEERPIEAIYCFPLPKDAALRAFRIHGEGFEGHSELKPVEEAVKAYESGIAAGSLSALARTYGDGLVNLTLGNIRPGETVAVVLEILAGVELRDDGFRFRFPFTLAPSYHAQARVAIADGEGEIELPSREFGDVILPPFRKSAETLHEVGFELSVLHDSPLAEIASPSHSIRAAQDAASTRVSLAREKDVPDRDLVLDARFRDARTQILAGPAENGARSFGAIVPSTAVGRPEASPRRLIILLDRSGSMKGAPLAQATKAIEACVAALGEEDQFGLVAFHNDVQTFEPTPVAANRENRKRAIDFLERIDARGGTGLLQGVLEAARILGGSGDIMLLTDGQVFGTEAILAKVRTAGIRLYCLGIGSASQDRFLALLARETGGVSRFVTPRERVDLTALDLFASIGRPVASGLKASAGVNPAPPDCVFAGTPVLLFGEIADGATNSIALTWNGGSLEISIPPGDTASGETLRLLRGARVIADLESRYPAEEALAPIEKRKQSRVATRLRELSEAYGLASREMSLVAVVRRAGDRAGDLPETRVTPVGMPQDMEFKSMFFPRMAPIKGQLLSGPQPAMAATMLQAFFPGLSFRGSDLAQPALPPSQAPPQAPVDDGASRLVALATMLEPDGGMPGRDLETRAARSLAAILAFVAGGSTGAHGPFRVHVSRLLQFLHSAAPGLNREKSRAIQAALTMTGEGSRLNGDWVTVALNPKADWKPILRRLP